MFENQSVKLEVNVNDDTVWLNREQIARLFDRDIKTIGKHINNALEEEIDCSTVAKFATVQKEGTRNVNRDIEYYNLDMIISVGYRVKSNNGVIFRKWANQILKEHLIKEYTINQRRLDYLEKTVKLIDIASRIDENIDTREAKEIFSIINKYSKSFEMLDNYDNCNLKHNSGNFSDLKINYEDCTNIIIELKNNEKSNLFGLEKEFGLISIIENIYQTFDENDVYGLIEEKASNFLYLIIKNHIFIDGNKRIGAALFIYFLQFYGILYKNDKLVIDEKTLTAITLLIAQSNPKEKDVIVDLVINFLV